MFYPEYGYTETTICPKCKKEFKYIKLEQEPGFRDDEELVCPYCKEIILSSRQWSYTSFEYEET